ncbi:MAG: dihydropteroate synthase [Pseudomonadota bacterium]
MQTGPELTVDVLPCCDAWFSHVEVLSRTEPPRIAPVSAFTQAELEPFMCVPAPSMLMGILNTTPDSFSDGGLHATRDAAVSHGKTLIAQGAHILDIGGESTRPGAEAVSIAEEIDRTAPVIRDLRAAGVTTTISIDTRKAAVAEAALEAGADMVNDVSGFNFDPDLAPLCAQRGASVCVMHAQGDPQTMQDNPTYDDVLLDVYDFLAERIAYLQSIGIARRKIIADPGVGFGKTREHNLALIKGISLFHGLGVPVLLGVSRKRFIGTIGEAPNPADRAPGSVAVALAAYAQGIRIFRVHDVADHAQAIALWRASVAHR